MLAFSCWKFDENFSIEDIKRKFEEIGVKTSVNFQHIVMEPLLHDVFIIKDYNFLNKNFKYMSTNLQMSNENGDKQDTQIMFFECNNKVYFNVFRGKNNVLKSIKEYFNDSTWGNIRSRSFDIDEDFLYWIFKSYIDTPEDAIVKDKDIYVTGLKSYKGVVRDLGTSLRGDGERISDILSTLAFLLNDDELKMVAPKITYKTPEVNSIHFSIYLTGTIRFDINNYAGELLSSDLNTDEISFLLSIIISEYLLPEIINGYKNAKNFQYWSSVIKRDFLMRVGLIIKRRVDDELHKLESEISQNEQATIDEFIEKQQVNIDEKELEEVETKLALEAMDD